VDNEIIRLRAENLRLRIWIERDVTPRYVDLLEAAGIDPADSVLVAQARDLLDRDAEVPVDAIKALSSRLERNATRFRRALRWAWRWRREARALRGAQREALRLHAAGCNDWPAALLGEDRHV
jgi:hypothetical protein